MVSIEAAEKLQLKDKKTPQILQIELVELRQQGNCGWTLFYFVFFTSERYFDSFFMWYGVYVYMSSIVKKNIVI